MHLDIFDIQRCSFVDGPGIRTTVFLKGCNLHCKWCHNPESWLRGNQLAYFAERCVKCGVCKAVCPSKAVKDDYHPNLSLCNACGHCVEHCPTSARLIYGQSISIDTLMQTLLSDRLFYETSDGGVTFSGGECMLQIDELRETLKLLKTEGIHTAVDTAGNVPWSSFESILPYTDLFLYDIKCMTSALHKELTGSENELILENYKRLLKEKAHVIARVPVVPCANDVNNEMQLIIEFLSQYKPEQAEFLPYHKMGEGKSSAIGKQKCVFDVPEATRIEALNQRISEVLNS